MPLTDAQRGELEATIQKRRSELGSELRAGLARSRRDTFGAIAGEAPDAGDEALASLVADTGNAETARDMNELRTLDAAIVRIEDGTYGTCSDCGGDIPFERLRAQPGANRCVRCQSVYEKTHRHPAEPSL